MVSGLLLSFRKNRSIGNKYVVEDFQNNYGRLSHEKTAGTERFVSIDDVQNRSHLKFHKVHVNDAVKYAFMVWER